MENRITYDIGFTLAVTLLGSVLVAGLGAIACVELLVGVAP